MRSARLRPRPNPFGSVLTKKHYSEMLQRVAQVRECEGVRRTSVYLRLKPAHLLDTIFGVRHKEQRNRVDDLGIFPEHGVPVLVAQ